jgi:hypothetical protein
MDMYDSLFSPNSILNEQIAREIFEILPESGPVMVIMDTDGHWWPSDSDAFAALNISEPFLRQVCASIDDGAEPVVTQAGECSVIAAQLATDRTNCGYVVIALPKSTPESAMANMDLVEIVLGQMSLIAKLVEKNALLYELQTKQYSLYAQSEPAAN